MRANAWCPDNVFGVQIGGESRVKKGKKENQAEGSFSLPTSRLIVSDPAWLVCRNCSNVSDDRLESEPRRLQGPGNRRSLCRSNSGEEVATKCLAENPLCMFFKTPRLFPFLVELRLAPHSYEGGVLLKSAG